MTAAGIFALLSLAVGIQSGHTRALDPALAQRLRTAALDQEAVLHVDSALVLYRAALRADSTDFVAEYQVVQLRLRRFEYAALAKEYLAPAALAGARGRCIRAYLVPIIEMEQTVASLEEIERSAGVSTCTAVLLAAASAGPQVPESRALAYGARGIRVEPRMYEVWESYAARLIGAGRAAEAESVLERGESAVGHPLLRIRLAQEREDLRLRMGDTAGTLAFGRALRAAVRRDGRPGLLVVYLAGLVGSHPLQPDEGGRDEIIRHLHALTSAAGDWPDEVRALNQRAKVLIDGGEPLKALPLLTRSAAIADSVRQPDLSLEVYTLRGRTFAKLGRFGDAERELRRALTFETAAARVYYRADAHHNLAHLYQGAGRWKEADREVTRFVTLTHHMVDALRITALLDAAQIRWQAGWHASALDSYEAMVRAIDELKTEYFWAGEYYERIGDLPRAAEYYKKRLATNPGDAPSLAGMVHVHQELGHLDSAETFARSHDARVADWTPLEVPLLPALLVRRGRPNDAIVAARAWTERQLRGGNVQGAARASLQLARLLLESGTPAAAIREAERADSLARALSLEDESLLAQVVRAVALGRTGESEMSITALEHTATEAARYPSTEIALESNLALGDALAASAQTERALSAYDRAGRAVEHVTGNLATDLDRAGYRERHLLPFDGALRMLLRPGDSERRLDQVMRWSSRRTAAALALSGRDAALAASEGRPVALAELRQRLAPDELLLDFIVLDSNVAVVAVASDTARLVRLPITAGSLGTAITRLRGPLVTTFGGRIDLARARYDLAAAAALYDALLRPLAALTRGKRRLIVVPDGPLHALAFDALVMAPPHGGADTDYRAATYVLDSLEIDYLPSPAFLRSEAERARVQRLGAQRLLAVGYGAPGNKAEIQAVRDIWPRERLTTLEGGAATERGVKARMAQFGILHFAVHAAADARDPLVAHLRLASDSLNDGYLHANEIAAMRTSADLVVLSACETNVGPIYGGEGVMGIARAFLAGGARAVVATQWPVGAETAELMREFYARLSHGESPASALRGAKLRFRRSTDFAHPFHWAGFLIIR